MNHFYLLIKTISMIMWYFNEVSFCEIVLLNLIVKKYEIIGNILYICFSKFGDSYNMIIWVKE